MPTVASPPPVVPLLSNCGVGLDTAPDKLGFMRDSSDIRGDREALKARMGTDGYVFLPGLLDRGEVLEARREMTGRLAGQGILDPEADPMDGIMARDRRVTFMPELAKGNAPLAKVVYDGAMMEFFNLFLGGAVRHYDFTWIRAVSPGHATPPHCDIVYMGRGTPDLYTAWTPFGDNDLTLGGLMVLEGSNNHQRLRDTYCRKDVDTYCMNKPDAPLKEWRDRKFGSLSSNPLQIQNSLGGRWVTADYHAGDVVVFSVYTVHAGLDNHSPDRIRLSSDTRYQLASEPVDERWIGEHPMGHGPAGQRGMIC
jgi:hypothetical protein